MSVPLKEEQKVRFEGLVIECLCLCNCPLELINIDDIGTRFYKCPQCGKTFNYAKSEIEKQREEEYKDLTRESTLNEVLEVLDMTIKFDRDVKAIVFLSLLTAYTEAEQVNIIMTGETSVGKTYCIGENIKFFPSIDRIKKHGVTPTAFFYDENRKLVDKDTLEEVELIYPAKDASQEERRIYREKKKNTVLMQDFERKIIWLPDMPDAKVMEKLRSILSHDDKICNYSSTMPMQMGLKAKEVFLRGFGVFVICTCTPYLDEQETSRAFQINPEWSPQKEKAVLDLIDDRDSSPQFNELLETNTKRIWLQKRVQLIKEEKINKIFIDKNLIQEVREWFEVNRKSSTPRSSREYTRLKSLAKAWCLFNLWNRERDENNNLYCTKTDVEVAKQVYETMIESSAYNLSPEEYNFFKQLEQIYKGMTDGFKVTNAHDIYYRNNGRPCSDKRLRNMLESFCREGLTRKDKRSQTIYYYIQEYEKQKYLPISLEKSISTNKKPKLVDKVEIILEILQPNIPMGIDQIQKIIKENNISLSIKEVNDIIQNLYNSGKIYKPNENGKYVRVG